ncbi:MAG: hypothetical protein D6722_25010, partial [Bacteroidetes bacterium]
MRDTNLPAMPLEIQKVVYVVLSDKLLALLKKYRDLYTSQYWLFEGMHGDRYSPRSVQQVMRRAVTASGIN